jgi:hypothetical protein
VAAARKLSSAAWRGSINGVNCVRGVTLNGKFQALTRLTEVVFDHGLSLAYSVALPRASLASAAVTSSAFR